MWLCNSAVAALHNEPQSKWIVFKRSKLAWAGVGAVGRASAHRDTTYLPVRGREDNREGLESLPRHALPLDPVHPTLQDAGGGLGSAAASVS